MRTIAALLIVLATTSAHADERLAQSRAIVDAFGAELKQTLQAAMRQGGPVAAIEICRDVAPALATKYSQQHSIGVGRVSLKTRNAGNTPDPWQRSVLTDFDSRAAAGENPAELETFAVGEDGAARYLKAIPVQSLCLACHGEQLVPEVAAALARDYPEDRATGYRLGELRGVFYVDWPAAP